MHGDIFRFAIDPIQAGPNGILPAFAARDNRADFFEPHVATDFPDLIMSFFTRYDNNFADGIRALERTDCASDHRFTRDYGKQFVESHALAAAAGDDDGAQHGPDVIR